MLSKWIESNGGPLILMESRLATHWTGIDGKDYERACAVDGYVGVLPVGKGQGLVLGDMPMRSAWLAEHDGGTFVRWMYANSEAAVLDALKNVDNAVQSNVGRVLQITFASKNLLLFDSAYSGAKASDALNIALYAGAYFVTASDFAPNKETRLILNRLRKISVASACILPHELSELMQNEVTIHDVDLSKITISHDVISKISASMARCYRTVPVAVDSGALTVAIADISNLGMLDDLRFLLNCEVIPVVASESQIVAALDKYYPL